MANAVNIFGDFSQTLTALLATSVSDGDYGDVLTTLKIDKVGQVTPATQINEYAGQLWSNAADDYISASYQFHYRAPKWWSVADATERDALGTTVGLTVDDVAFQRDLNLFFAVVSVDGPAASTWVGSGGSLQAAYEVAPTIVTDAGNGSFGVTGTEGWVISASAGSGALSASTGVLVSSSAGNVGLTSILAQISLSADTNIACVASNGQITLNAIEGPVGISAGAPASGNAHPASMAGGDANGGNGDGGNVPLTAGAPDGSGTPGHVQLQNAASALVDEESIVASLENLGSGTGGGDAVNLYVMGLTTPIDASLVAPQGSLAIFTPEDSNLYVNTDSGWHPALQSLQAVYDFGFMSVTTTGVQGLNVGGTAPWSLVGTEGAGTLAAGAPASGNAFGISIAAGTALAGNGNGGVIDVIGGAPQGSGAGGYVALKNAASALVSQATPVAVLQNQGSGTGGGSGVAVFVVESAPSAGLAAAVGGFALRNVGGAGTAGEVWHKLGAGSLDWHRSGAYLFSATTIVDVGAATAPAAGQVLKATGDTAATWQDETRLRFTALKTGAYTAVVGDLVLFDTTSFTFDLDMPASPATNDRVGFKQRSNSVVPVTIDGNGNDVEDPATYILSSTVQLGGDGISVVYQYDGTQWLLV